MLKDKTVLALAAILSLTVIQVNALHLGVNGQLMTVVVAVVAGLGGFGAKAWYDKHKGGLTGGPDT